MSPAFMTQYAAAKAQQEPREPRRCSFGDCSGTPVFNGMCVFHAWARDVYHRGAVTAVLRRNPSFHGVIENARQCARFDPPNSEDEWKVVLACFELLRCANQLPEQLSGLQEPDVRALVTHTKRVSINGMLFGAKWIGDALEAITIAEVHMQADRVLAASADKKSLLSTYDKVDEMKKFRFRERDFQEFSKLPMFGGEKK